MLNCQVTIYCQHHHHHQLVGSIYYMMTAPAVLRAEVGQNWGAGEKHHPTKKDRRAAGGRHAQYVERNCNIV